MNVASPPIRFDVFISYSRYDRDWVKTWLEPRLIKSRLVFDYDERDTPSHRRSPKYIEQAVRSSLITLLVLTPHWVQSSAAYAAFIAHNNHPDNPIKERIMPLLLAACDLPKHIDELSYADFTDQNDWGEQLQRIIDQVMTKKRSIPQEQWPTAWDPHKPYLPPQPIDVGDPFEQGRIIGKDGRYRIEHMLSQGSFGTAYLAHDLRLESDCVIKRLLLNAMLSEADQHERIDYFKREVTILIELSQSLTEGIPRIRDLIEEQHSFVMDYIRGKDFEHILKDNELRPLPLREALDCVQIICKTLISVHRPPATILHRDIKPSNILRGEDGRIWLIDFGLGKLQEQASGAAPGSAPLGTYFYMAPEQQRGHAQARSDIFSLARTLYVLLAGSPPRTFSLGQLPPIRQSNPRVPPELEALINRAMAEQPDERPDAQQFYSALEAIQRNLTGPAITLPDGSPANRLHDLVQWCEGNWERAADWLYRTLPNDLEENWREKALAQQLRDIVKQHPLDRNAGLDLALAALEPQSFGQEQPKLAVSHQTIDFRVTDGLDQPVQAIELINTGRRYIRAQIERPGWVTTATPTVPLIPKEHTMVRLELQRRFAPRNHAVRDAIVVRQGGIFFKRIEVRLQRGGARRRWAVWMLLAIVVVAIFIAWRYS